MRIPTPGKSKPSVFSQQFLPLWSHTSGRTPERRPLRLCIIRHEKRRNNPLHDQRPLHAATLTPPGFLRPRHAAAAVLPSKGNPSLLNLKDVDKQQNFEEVDPDLDSQRRLAQICLQAVFSRGFRRGLRHISTRWRIHPYGPEQELAKGAERSSSASFLSDLQHAGREVVAQ